MLWVMVITVKQRITLPSLSPDPQSVWSDSGIERNIELWLLSAAAGSSYRVQLPPCSVETVETESGRNMAGLSDSALEF